MIKVIVHLGIYKTATTYLQNTLMTNNDVLKANKIAYIPMTKMRKNGITRAITNVKTTADEVYELILANIDCQDYNTILISEELILGGVYDIRMHDKIAPRLHYRINKIKEVFKTHDTKYYFCIREYSSFYRSVYCEFLRHAKHYMTFKNFIGDFDYLNYSWKDLILELMQEVGKEKLTIFTFENFIKKEDHYFKMLLNDYDLKLREYLTKNTRKSFANKSIEILDCLSHEFSGEFVIKLLHHIDLNIHRLNFKEKFNPWSKSEQKHLKNKYINDINEIEKLKINIV